MRARVLIATAIAAVTMSACSGAADPAEVDELADSLANENALGVAEPEGQAECRARLYLESDLSDEALEAIHNGEPPAPKTDEDVDVLRELADQIAEECVGRD